MGISTIFGLFFLIYCGYKVEWTSLTNFVCYFNFHKGILIAIEVKPFLEFNIVRIAYKFITCPILAYRLLVIG